MEPLLFRPRYLRGAIVLAGSLPFVAFGVVGVAAHPAFVAFAALGALGTAGGVGILLTRVAVDGAGVRKSPGWAGGFRAGWADIESWSVRPLDFDGLGGGDSMTFRAVVLRLRGRRRPAEVTDSEAYRPGLDALVTCLRSRLPTHEEAAPGTSPE